MSRIVIALGGNALGNNPEEQKELVKLPAKKIAELVKAGHEVIVGHGNGPQVGMIFNGMSDACKVNVKSPLIPLPEAGAMSQGYIGLHMVNAITNAFTQEKLEKEVLYILTQTLVDEKDKAFQNPTKPIGPFYATKEEAEKMNPNSTIVEDAGRGFRKVVASPLPLNFVGINQIKAAVENGATVIVGGGGGIPSVKDKKGFITPVDGVIDKDFALAKIASLVKADYFVVLTAVDNVMVNYKQPNQKALTHTNKVELEKYIQENQFAPGSMLPKVKAAIKFVEEGGKASFIGDLKDLEAIIAEKTGTKITLK
ncbi:carbamate kinase [Metamycoplasma hyosynoviae]|uniref:Carbamate kinase n=1 Tax=Metamycoplasma hyosynoviae TaxID=29559 RepID=A0A4R7TX27_9BACT|nr:carbamate kinase [Metamycoplasma hyosynoviae]MDC8900230.1 carbamate kinase [Metamycoplasma hyosynoviae]MDC8901276.1 carbamate kinase [Metamycoplasma hyosynoviae]MDC8912721.1 carbamate kinase [Metamycoplasma hyosynoviae]MDC8913249.1 carbamate kinase [Metamycoplasma hyosynoviae]MDC8914034.1 carbamate kinase [Metamycoplasma hyosynoviae]